MEDRLSCIQPDDGEQLEDTALWPVSFFDTMLVGCGIEVPMGVASRFQVSIFLYAEKKRTST